MAFIYALAFLLLVPHLIIYEGKPILTVPALSSMQKVADFLLVIHAPYPVLSLAFIPGGLNPERLDGSYIWKHIMLAACTILSYALLSVIQHQVVVHTAKRFEEVKRETKEVVKDVTENEDERLEETLEYVKRKGPYYSAVCLQYIPKGNQHDEKIVLRKLLWALASKTVQGCACCLAESVTASSTSTVSSPAK